MDVKNNGAADLSLLEPIFEKYKEQKGALIPILQQTQGIYGYLPPEAMQRIADRLGIALSKVYGVTTFYSQFYLERRGRHVLRLCDGTACHVKGAPVLITAVEEEYGVSPGETTEDGELSVEIVYCLGSCALAPLATLDDQILGRMRSRTLKQRVKKHIESAKKESGV